MHTFFKTLFRFLVFSKGFYYLLNGNSLANFVFSLGYTTLNIHEIWLRLFRGERLLYIRAKMTSFVNSHD